MQPANTNPNSESVLSKFHHSITGNVSGPKMVFLHGVMGFSLNWRRIIKAFEADYHCLVYDQRGHGRSFQPAIGYNSETLAQDLEEILNELGWNEINLVGHSMGGRAAYYFASHHPERVTQLVIEDIGPSSVSTGTGTTFIERMLSEVPVPFASKKEARTWFDTEFLRIFADNRKKEQLAEYLYANLKEDENGQAVWRFYEPGIRETVISARAAARWEDIEALTMPTLVMRGEYSQDLPVEVYEKMLATNAKIQGVEFKGCGHWIHADQPDLFITVLRQFLNGEAIPSHVG